MATSAGTTIVSSTSPNPSPTSSCLSTGATCGIPSPGTLYLFTFLATLVLLTVVAGGIISRSVYLRRQHRQLIASGRWVPPGQPPKVEPNLTKKPQIFDAYLGGAVAENELRQWESMMPFSLTVTAQDIGLPSEPEQPQPQTNAVGVGGESAESTISGTPRIFSRRRRVLQPTNTNHNIPVLAVPTETSAIKTPVPAKASAVRTEIACIIVMPILPHHGERTMKKRDCHCLNSVWRVLMWQGASLVTKSG
ncbi:hypothetical protein MVEN_00686700 [Mycena venus]|uniref:Transmembrane protein n=1 Tax=Mycena venus TaxID=2733690 RepID=A0A8H6YJW8_9AGAR|nr:hypothetical protein MVEN_00686700 [Mycena venus]